MRVEGYTAQDTEMFRPLGRMPWQEAPRSDQVLLVVQVVFVVVWAPRYIEISTKLTVQANLKRSRPSTKQW